MIYVISTVRNTVDLRLQNKCNHPLSFSGYLRDSTGNYALCICVMSGLLLIFSAMWVAEFYILRKKLLNKYTTVNRENRISVNVKDENSK